MYQDQRADSSNQNHYFVENCYKFAMMDEPVSNNSFDFSENSLAGMNNSTQITGGHSEK